MPLTEDQITQLAPDAASVKAGQQLATNSKWVTKAIHEKAMWGDCQGSGKNPYRTVVDLQNMAFKCSCPSRKFPCKHGLGLLYLHARTPSVFEATQDVATDVQEWLTKRAGKAEAKEEKETMAAPKKLDTKAQERRSEEREKKVAAGLEELRMWLKDLVRNGIHQVPSVSQSFHRPITARMVDAQAPAIANSLNRLSQLPFHQEGWQKPFLRKLSSLYLLTEAFKNSENVSPLLQTEIRTLIGWNTGKEQVLQQEGLQDTWLVLSRELEEEDRLTTERIWLFGLKSQRFALLLNFYPLGQMPQFSIVVGSAISAEVVFYSAVFSLRALLKNQHGMGVSEVPIAEPNFKVVLQKVAEALSVQPFMEQIPFLVEQVRVVHQKGVWYLVDKENLSLRLLNPEVDGWRTLATTGSAPFTAFLVYEPQGVTLHAYWISQQFYALA
ncbi:SWIM zinc finger family protein [Rufibacter hautae]|uniref:SWIM zinc finger family protein n=1 Tax=Rufibacter hautae TaxID=2595005 RepID=A0A5B6TC05_9BACT|nr:SWIM zinc finger family protein [Rufibacter hautae]KAA3437150.1 SWIM zinc finger family protein [Rufibacter hautae]